MTTQTPDRQAFLDTERSKWLTPSEAAVVLRVSRNKMTELLRNGLPHRRDGKLIRIHLDDLRPTHQEGCHVE
jgi:excisionase family DNA binding protein